MLQHFAELGKQRRRALPEVGHRGKTFRQRQPVRCRLRRGRGRAQDDHGSDQDRAYDG
jgi:hypothetical protein